MPLSKFLAPRPPALPASKEAAQGAGRPPVMQGFEHCTVEGKKKRHWKFSIVYDDEASANGSSTHTAPSVEAEEELGGSRHNRSTRGDSSPLPGGSLRSGHHPRSTGSGADGSERQLAELMAQIEEKAARDAEDVALRSHNSNRRCPSSGRDARGAAQARGEGGRPLRSPPRHHHHQQEQQQYPPPPPQAPCPFVTTATSRHSGSGDIFTEKGSVVRPPPSSLASLASAALPLHPAGVLGLPCHQLGSLSLSKSNDSNSVSLPTANFRKDTVVFGDGSGNSFLGSVRAGSYNSHLYSSSLRNNSHHHHNNNNNNNSFSNSNNASNKSAGRGRGAGSAASSQLRTMDTTLSATVAWTGPASAGDSSASVSRMGSAQETVSSPGSATAEAQTPTGTKPSAHGRDACYSAPQPQPRVVEVPAGPAAVPMPASPSTIIRKMNFRSVIYPNSSSSSVGSIGTGYAAGGSSSGGSSKRNSSSGTEAHTNACAMAAARVAELEFPLCRKNSLSLVSDDEPPPVTPEPTTNTTTGHNHHHQHHKNSDETSDGTQDSDDGGSAHSDGCDEEGAITTHSTSAAATPVDDGNDDEKGAVEGREQSGGARCANRRGSAHARVTNVSIPPLPRRGVPGVCPPAAASPSPSPSPSVPLNTSSSMAHKHSSSCISDGSPGISVASGVTGNMAGSQSGSLDTTQDCEPSPRVVLAGGADKQPRSPPLAMDSVATAERKGSALHSLAPAAIPPPPNNVILAGGLPNVGSSV